MVHQKLPEYERLSAESDLDWPQTPVINISQLKKISHNFVLCLKSHQWSLLNSAVRRCKIRTLIITTVFVTKDFAVKSNLLL